jgi:glutathione S-transferase
MLKLHSYDRSPFGQKVRIVLEEKKIPYESLVPPQNKGEDAAFARLNPFRLTPVLELEDGRTVWESTVINEYLEETHPSPPLLPRDPYERARVRMLEDSTDQYLYESIWGVIEAQFEYAPPFLIRKKPEQVDHKALEQSRIKVHENLARLERELKGRTWFGGEIFSLADATLVAPLTGALRLLGILPDPKYPSIAAWSARVLERPSCRAAAPKEPLRIKEG